MSLLLARIAASHRAAALPANVMLSLAMTGADGGTSFPDTSSNNFAVTTHGGVQTKATGVPGGGSATYFNGTDAWLVLPNSAAINNFGTGDFSITVDVYATDTAAEHIILACVSSWTSAAAYNLEIRPGGDLRFYAGDSVPIAIIGGSGSLAVNTWQTVKVERVSGVTTLYVDGVSKGSHTGSVSISNASTPKIGVFPPDSSTPWVGYMRNLVITKG